MAQNAKEIDSTQLNYYRSTNKENERWDFYAAKFPENENNGIRQPIEKFQNMNDTIRINENDSTVYDWWNWSHQLVSAVTTASNRLGLALMVTGGMLAAAIMFGNEAGARYAPYVLGVAAFFAILFLFSKLRDQS